MKICKILLFSLFIILFTGNQKCFSQEAATEDFTQYKACVSCFDDTNWKIQNESSTSNGTPDSISSTPKDDGSQDRAERNEFGREILRPFLWIGALISSIFIAAAITSITNGN